MSRACLGSPAMPAARTITGLAAMLRSGETSSRDLCRETIGRIRARADLNAFITIAEDAALAEAGRADALLSGQGGGDGARNRAGDGALGALTGIPIAHKDIFSTFGVRTTCGSRMLAEYIPAFDATVVANLKAAGAVTIGKTNMDEFAMGSSNENSFFGAVANPWDAATVPGGSSGGSAAAVAARLLPAATGTDTGGSIRQPAAFCGITGLKPSYGRVSRHGMVAFASSLDQAGTLTVTCEDAAIMLDAMAGFDPRDSTSVDAPPPRAADSLGQTVAGLTIGLPAEFFGGGLDSAVAASVQAALAELEKAGARLVDVALPSSENSIPCYYIIAPAEASSNLSRFDGVRYGFRAGEFDGLTEMYEKTRAEGFGAEVKRRIMVGAYVLSAGYYDAYYMKALKLRRLIADDFARAFERCDVIAGPTTPTCAFRRGAKMDDPVAMYLNDIYTSSVNLAGLPALSIPAGLVSGGEGELPVGLHLIGPYMAEAKLLGVGHQFQQLTDWHERAPPGVGGE